MPEIKSIETCEGHTWMIGGEGPIPNPATVTADGVRGVEFWQIRAIELGEIYVSDEAKTTGWGCRLILENDETVFIPAQQVASIHFAVDGDLRVTVDP